MERGLMTGALHFIHARARAHTHTHTHTGIKKIHINFHLDLDFCAVTELKNSKGTFLLCAKFNI